MSACGGGAATTTDVTETTSAPTTVAPTTTAAPTTSAAAADLTPEQIEALYRMCALSGDPMAAYLGVVSGQTKMPPEMLAVFEREPEPASGDQARAVIAMACNETRLPPRPSTTTVAGASNSGMMVMEFGDHRLEYQIEDCDLAALADGQISVGSREIAVDTDGSEWQVTAFVLEDGTWVFEAINGPYFQAGSPDDELEVEVEGNQAVFSTVFHDNVFEGEPNTPVTITVTCGS
jgi:hypothetical protein